MHTKGPWQATPWGQTISIDAKGYNGIAVIAPRMNPDYGIPKKLDRENAALIAAAPELLEACRDAVSMLMHLDYTWAAVLRNKIDKVIAKAEGK